MSQIDIREIVQIQQQLVADWHEEEVSNNHSGFLSTVCTQHGFNFRLWHEEDIARCPNASDAEIAQVKRNIDGLNQQRNDWIEKLDDEISRMLATLAVEDSAELPLSTETPGSAIDRLSILALRLYHLQEQLERDDVDNEHCASVERKIAVCRLQQAELAGALQQLVNDIFAGTKRHRTYRQFKMYNDPALNPYLYDAAKPAA